MWKQTTVLETLCRILQTRENATPSFHASGFLNSGSSPCSIRCRQGNIHDAGSDLLCRCRLHSTMVPTTKRRLCQCIKCGETMKLHAFNTGCSLATSQL
ncbi:hypothetical protein JTE90_013391 [Oedothorax gibbosus]|uniref:Uncharacterized protein n=1 Tax=Oedothorax gibbosus TaxID=931172 RepID=A0AAV6TW08_9ARAC|nr:hypothetical protein JTE90_013391 [Oedothorax gibbosus]